MSSGPVAFIDSGIGGLPYLGTFAELAPRERIVYVADRAAFPYGEKDADELRDLVLSLIRRIVATLDPKLVVVACNTASVVALAALRTAFPSIPFVGTVPAVKTAGGLSSSRRIGILATERTVNDPYVGILAERYASDCVLEREAAPELVDFVERRYLDASEEERLQVAERYVRRFGDAGVDTIVLGCTHFLFLSGEFSRVSGGAMRIVDSRDGVARRALALLRERGLISSGPGGGTLFVTGEPPFEASWERFASRFGLEFGGPLRP